MDYYPWIGTTTLHFVLGASLTNGCQLTYTSTSAFTSQLTNAIATWNNLTGVDVLSATTTPDVSISDANRDDVVWKGITSFASGTIILNSYYLVGQTSDQIRNTITHEIGHTLGLDHSYTGNVMYFNQTNQTNLGPIDLSDYYYIWNNVCP